MSAPALELPGAQVQRELTPAQLDTLRLIAAGHTYGQAAAKLSYSPDTVRRRMGQVFKRLGVRNAPHAVAVAYERGILIPGGAS